MSTVVQQPVATTPVATPENISKASQIVTNIIFWGAFISFLSTSIPHVAWLYNVYEPQDQPIWWVMCYAVAISIDVMIAWLSFVQTMSKFKDGWLTWMFIGQLSALSWYANYLYDMKNNPIVQHDMWNIQIFFGYTTTGYITPIIISAIPLFSIAYTFMLSKVGNRKVETLDEMRARLADTKERKRVEEELKTVGKVGWKDRIIGGIGDAKEVIAATKTEHKVEVNEHENGGITPPLPSDFTSTNAEQNTDEVFHIDEAKDGNDNPLEMERDAEQFEELDVEELEPEAGTLDGSFSEVKTERITGKLVPQDGSDTDPEAEVVGVNLFHNSGTARASKSSTSGKITRRKSMTVEEVAEVLNVTSRQVRNLRSRGLLIQDDNNLITVSSVNAYLKRKEKVS